VALPLKSREFIARMGDSFVRVRGVTTAALCIIDNDGRRLEINHDDALGVFQLAEGLEAATTSSCTECRSRVIASGALSDLLSSFVEHPRVSEIIAFADDASTLHIYVIDVESPCAHRTWRDPGREEFFMAVKAQSPIRKRR
jgi:hypothetical protein